MTPETLMQKIEEARADRKSLVLKSLFTKTPPWETFISYIQKQSETPPPHIPLIPLEERTINGIIVRNLFYITATNPSV
jgi:hypothetical protein